MDMIITPSYKDLERAYREYFSMAYLGKDFSNKLALISLICYITKTLQMKKPDVTYYQVVKKLGDGTIPDEYINRLAIICEDWSYGCDKETFPTFGLEDKQIPAKIKEILHNWLPF